MGYKVDYDPIDYLKRRVIYYKKRRGLMNSSLNKKQMIQRFSKEGLLRGIDYLNSRISLFEKAIKKLEK